MKQLALALVLLAACTSEAGSDCPPVPQPGQTCKTNNTVCIYGPAGKCMPTPEYRCTNGRFVQVQTSVPPSCDASTDAPADAPKDSPQDAPKDAAQDSPSDSPSDG